MGFPVPSNRLNSQLFLKFLMIFISLLLQYYSERYNKAINDHKQPLIISMPKLREERSGEATGPVFLIPELVYMTGLSEEQRSNFQLMKNLGEYTRQDPKKRVAALKKFSERLNTTPEITQDMQGWDLKFSRVNLPALIESFVYFFY